MSQRIDDTIQVLDHIRESARQKQNMFVVKWRKEAMSKIASRRRVKPNTVFAHIVGKNTPNTISADKFDALVKSWITSGSDDLKVWILSTCSGQDMQKMKRFFSNEHPTPLASDINEPIIPERFLITTYRILRDTPLARRIKEECDYKCQICNLRILLAEGKPYAEAHHVKPLGNPHNGLDQVDNIVCVCPNCHVKLDYGAIKMDQGRFRALSPEFIQYHNLMIAGTRSPS